jgi:hypothetical protein
MRNEVVSSDDLSMMSGNERHNTQLQACKIIFRWMKKVRIAEIYSELEASLPSNSTKRK